MPAVSPLMHSSDSNAAQLIGDLQARVEVLERTVRDRERLIELLRDSDARTRAILRTSVDGIVTIDERGIIESFNPAAEWIFGYREDEVLGRNVSMLMPAPYRDRHDGYLARYLQTGENRVIGIGREVRGLRKGGLEFHMELGISETHFGSRRLFTGVVRDISERKAAERELARLRARLQSIIDSMPAVLIGVDLQGTVTQWNRRAEQVSGVRATAALGRRLKDVFPQLRGQTAMIAQVVRTGRPSAIERITCPAPDETCYREVMIYPLQTEHETGAVILVDEVTPRVRLEERLLQDEKMASLAALSAGVVQRMAVPLQALRAAGGELERIAPDSGDRAGVAHGLGADLSQVHQLLRSLDGAVAQVEEVIAALAAMLPQERGMLCEIEVPQLIERALRRLRDDPPPGCGPDLQRITIECRHDPSSGTLFCDSEALVEALVEVLRQAASACVSAQGRGGNRLRVVISTGAEHGQAWIEVRDSGQGMDDVQRRRVFDPAGPLGGWGLATAYSIVARHGGVIAVDSVSGRGTRFVIRLPTQG